MKALVSDSVPENGKNLDEDDAFKKNTNAHAERNPLRADLLSCPPASPAACLEFRQWALCAAPPASSGKGSRWAPCRPAGSWSVAWWIPPLQMKKATLEEQQKHNNYCHVQTQAAGNLQRSCDQWEPKQAHPSNSSGHSLAASLCSALPPPKPTSLLFPEFNRKIWTTH